MIFLSTTFVPKELIEAEWLKVAATLNPTTYIMEGMRAVLLRDAIDWSVYTQGVIVAAVLSIAMVVFAAMNARGALKNIKNSRTRHDLASVRLFSYSTMKSLNVPAYKRVSVDRTIRS
ncbi:hypothetical protein [Exiguobacterium antarcticum]|uniref:hypothetical protein n=1 Tax=Exiguobacterium antarcticum TaxID=132920 RepID=UPI00047C26DD|nr:hypothetical protein [Exiguobacterium antarcticum]